MIALTFIYLHSVKGFAGCTNRTGWFLCLLFIVINKPDFGKRVYDGWGSAKTTS